MPVLDGDLLSPKSGTATSQLFGPCLLWPNGRPSQLLLSSCYSTSTATGTNVGRQTLFTTARCTRMTNEKGTRREGLHSLQCSHLEFSVVGRTVASLTTAKLLVPCHTCDFVARLWRATKSHAAICRASESRDKIARQNRRCDMALTGSRVFLPGPVHLRTFHFPLYKCALCFYYSHCYT